MTSTTPLRIDCDAGSRAVSERLSPTDSWATGQSTLTQEWANRFEMSVRRNLARLSQWAADGASLRDEGIEPPTPLALNTARELLRRLQTRVLDRVPPSDAILLDFNGLSVGCGGEITIELGAGGLRRVVDIEPDGTATQSCYLNGKRMRRETIC